VWVPRQPGDTRGPRDIPESERWYFLEERYPTYGNLVPRDIATREIFSVCREGFSVDPDAYCVYLDLTHIDRAELDRKLMGILEIYEKFQGVDPRVEPMKIFPAVHYSMGGLWCAFEKDEATGGLNVGSPRNQLTNVPGLYAIGEADYQYHGGNRLGANSLLSCIFSGLIVAPGIVHHLKNLPHGGVGDQPASRFDGAAAACKRHYDDLVNNDGGENPYELHMTLGDEMTRNVTVVRNNRDLEATVTKIQELQERFKKVTVPDKSGWTNQPVVYTWALGDMLVLAEVIAQGALLRNECRGAHYKPAFDMPKMDADEPVELRRQARRWCDAFGKKNEQWLKSTVAEHTPDGPRICYEAVDVSLIPPRPRTYGLVGAEVIEQTWREATASVVEPKTEAATAS
jgi:succinate dehydrogenase / fumarate reductase flavoprotein subunit